MNPRAIVDIRLVHRVNLHGPADQTLRIQRKKTLPHPASDDPKWFWRCGFVDRPGGPDARTDLNTPVWSTDGNTTNVVFLLTTRQMSFSMEA